MGLYENIKIVASSKGKSINKMEQELGFARSSISKFNANTPSIDKVQTIADYLGVTIDYLMNPTASKEEDTERDVSINEVLDSLLRSLDNGTGLYPSGKAPQTVAEKVALANSIRLVMETVDSMDK